jgi:branched-subunit amino acid aminotransferase/4-amino-4-deoxychorismate lyase
MSLFESMRVGQGRVEFWEAHQRRLMTGCVERDFFVADAAIARAGEVLAEAGMDGFARIYITAGDGGPATEIKHPRVFVLLESRELEREDCWEICFCDEPYLPVFPGLKTANYWFHCEALAQARARKRDEALIFNDHAELMSACCANVFIVRDDRILTPSKASGCRPGVVREWVTKRRKVEEKRLRREDVVNADEIFLTNSWLGVMPVATLEGRPLGPRSIGGKLAADFAASRDDRESLR